jgi:FkbM family methyltransferase
VYYDAKPGARSLSPTFATDPPTMPFQSHSQIKDPLRGQDLTVLEIFRNKTNGFYVDLAANMYMEGSNTYLLDDFKKWKGICIEPNPKYLEGIVSNRSCALFNCAASKSSGEVMTFRFGGGKWGGFVGKGFDNTGEEKTEDRTVVTTTLTDILNYMKAPKVMDYLSLDVEGAEHYALAGLDHSEYHFIVVTIERPKPHSHHLLAKAGYRFLYQMAGFGECLYLHRSAPDYDALVEKYYLPGQVPQWKGGKHPYILHPLWNETYVSGAEFTFR